MPVDGYREVRHYESWTIEVEPSPAIVARWRRWRSRWRADYHKFTQGLFYEAVDAIQDDILFRRRRTLELAEGCAHYFFRCEFNAIRITIEKIDFNYPDSDPDPHGGEFALHPLEPLFVNVSRIGREFRSDYVEGVWLRPSHINGFDQSKLACATHDAHSSADRIIGSTSCSYSLPFILLGDLSSPRRCLNISTSGKIFTSYASWKIDRLFQNDIADRPSIQAGACITSDLANHICKGGTAESKTNNHYAVKYSYLLSNTTHGFLPEIYSRFIYPSGLL